ncbi:cupin domain-containing protein [Methylonatrum kenyense]|uniref:cupin domain-containing protein n=1 Tax=Methylonatrum kenyense TaxID=455253 RepID=UPI0020BF2D9F|nr:cupin domain-containing protein [Methylonatrum kenyense]MCK8516042.1 cupin domain-containing protein [Methylonatrum kenyense]
MAKVIRARDYRWDSVDLKQYKTEGTGFRDITRQTLLGEGSDESRLNFITRYFEVQPGGYSSLEHHEHPHAVVVIRGRGEVILQDRVEPIELHDCVYISSHTVHQFHPLGDEPLGFLCIVDRERDRPQIPDDESVARLRENDAVGRRLKI